MVKRVIIVSCMIVVMSAVVHAQVSYEPERGFSPGMDQLGGSIDNIDAASGRLHLKIPIASLPSGNGGTGVNVPVEEEHL